MSPQTAPDHHSQSQDPQTIGKNDGTNEQEHASPKAELPTKWLSFEMVFLGLGCLMAFVGLSVAAVHGFDPRANALLVLVAAFNGALAYGLEERRLWGWRLNWVFVGMSWFVPVLCTVEAHFRFGLPGSLTGLLVLAVIWVWPNCIYFRKRLILFQPAIPLRRFRDIALPLVVVVVLGASVLAIQSYQAQQFEYETRLSEYRREWSERQREHVERERQKALDEQGLAEERKRLVAQIADAKRHHDELLVSDLRDREAALNEREHHPSFGDTLEEALELEYEPPPPPSSREPFLTWSSVFSLCSLLVGSIIYFQELKTVVVQGGREVAKSVWTRALAFSCAAALVSVAALTVAVPDYSFSFFSYDSLVGFAASLFALSLTYNIRKAHLSQDYFLAAALALLAACLLHRWH